MLLALAIPSLAQFVFPPASGNGNVSALSGLGAAGGEVQLNCQGADKGKLCNDGANFTYDLPSHTLTLAELFTGGVLGGLYLDGLGADVASAATIAMPTNTVFRVTGTAAINTITPVSGCIQPSLTNNSGCRIVMIPTGAWTTTTAGNIATAITATVGVPVIATYLNSTTKWYITSGTGQFGSNMTSVGGVGDVDTAKILSRATDQAGTDKTCKPASASGTAYLCGLTPALTGYTQGMTLSFLPDVASSASSPPTLNIDTLGPIALVKNVNGTLTAIGTNDLKPTTPYNLIATGNPVSGFEVLPSDAPMHSITAVIDGGGSAITTGALKDFPTANFTCTITKAQISADQSGSITVEIDKHNAAIPNTTTDKISAAAPVTLSASQLNQNSALTGWTTAVAIGDVFGFNVASAATITHAVVQLWCQ